MNKDFGGDTIRRRISLLCRECVCVSCIYVPVNLCAVCFFLLKKKMSRKVFSNFNEMKDFSNKLSVKYRELIARLNLLRDADRLTFFAFTRDARWFHRKKNPKNGRSKKK